MLSGRDYQQTGLKRFILYCTTFFISIFYSQDYAQRFMYGDFQLLYKPFIYRQFSIRVIDFLDKWVELKYGYAAMLFVGMFSILFVAACIYLIEGTRPDIKYKEILVLSIFSSFCISFSYEMKPADIATAFLFTAALAFLAHGDLNNYLLVFLISTTHRETSILLFFVFMVYCFNQDIKGFYSIAAIQIIFYFAFQFCIRSIFQDAPGLDLWYTFPENIQFYKNNLLYTFGFSFLIALILLTIRYQWKYKNRLLKIAFLQMSPVIFVCFFLFGQPLELRVFAEVFTTSIILMLPEL